jgi:hypothetical protein
MLRTSALVALTFTLLIGAAGCSETKTFTVVFANLLPAGHDINCYMNGTLLGTVASGATGEFSADTRRSATPASPSTPDHSEANVVFTARDLSTGALSRAIAATISTDQTAYVQISAGNF